MPVRLHERLPGGPLNNPSVNTTRLLKRSRQVFHHGLPPTREAGTATKSLNRGGKCLEWPATIRMRPERWRRIEELYHGAEALPPGERTAFLQGACPDDDAVRRDVESLLNESASSDGLLDKHALVAGAELEVEDVAPGSMAGRSIGTYQLQALIGAGGMGEVYRARDTTLGRDVAIKILPAALMNDADRLARLEREARVLASLNHPGICAIYGIDEADGIRLLVLELVEGETLADRLAARRESGKRGLAISDALSIARQIADALEDAHDKGIVHRDLKPANIKITPDGVVKVLDFGLAKAVGGDCRPDLT